MVYRTHETKLDIRIYMADRTNPRSNAYQWKFAETSIGDVEFSKIPEEKTDPMVEERRADLKAELFVEIRRLIMTKLTDYQRDIVIMFLAGHTQMEISRKLNVNQSSITKCLYGNYSYPRLPGKKALKYGGIKKKLQKLAANDPKIQSIMKELQEL